MWVSQPHSNVSLKSLIVTWSTISAWRTETTTPNLRHKENPDRRAKAQTPDLGKRLGPLLEPVTSPSALPECLGLQPTLGCIKGSWWTGSEAVHQLPRTWSDLLFWQELSRKCPVLKHLNAHHTCYSLCYASLCYMHEPEHTSSSANYLPVFKH